MAQKNNKTPIPTTSAFHNFAFCPCLHSHPLAIRPPHSVSCLLYSALPAYPALLAPCALVSCVLVPCALPPFMPSWLSVNYAKQTQFSKRTNHHNLCCLKGLRQSSAPSNAKKQTQTNPIPPTQYAAEAPCGAIRNTQCEKRNPNKPNFKAQRI